MFPTQLSPFKSYLTCVFDVVDVLPLAERVAVLAPARARPLAHVHQVPLPRRLLGHSPNHDLLSAVLLGDVQLPKVQPS